MRLLTITIYARPNTTDNTYTFNSLNLLSTILVSSTDVSRVYQFNSMNLNYSILTSTITSILILTMDVPMTQLNVLRSGQPIEITDNGNTIFQGILLTPQYQMLPVHEDGSSGGMLVVFTLAPSIYQLSLLPMLFDPTQKTQIDSLLGIDTSTILVGQVGQQVSTQLLLDYMITNTDFADFFDKTIEYDGLPDNVFLMATAGQSRDSVLRSSIDFTNTVFYQQEDGELIIRPLDATIKAPFIINITNDTQSDGFPGLLEYTYTDNAASTPAIISNYNILSPALGVVSNASANYLSYKPNPVYFTRIQQLQSTGWFSGVLGNTPINNNIVNNPSVQAFLGGLQTQPDQYMISSSQVGAKQNFITAYQALITGKAMGQALTTYSNLECQISLDDQYFPTTTSTNYLLLGKCVDILNCDMKAGIIGAYSRNYSPAGSYINLNIVPLGSITGYWTN